MEGLTKALLCATHRNQLETHSRLDLRPDATKTLEGKTGAEPLDGSLSVDLFGCEPEAKATKAKINKRDDIK